MTIDYALYKQVMEYLAQYLKLSDKILKMQVMQYDEVIDGIKVLIKISDINGNTTKYCIVKFNNALDRAEPNCVDNEKDALRIYRETY
jgi:hypothetical protein